MTASSVEWMKVKSEQMLRNQVEQIAKSEYPASDFAEGALEMAYGAGLLSDARYEYWKHKIELSVCARRLALNEIRRRALFDAPVVVNGELIAGGVHENG